MEKYFQALRKCSLFSGIDDRDLTVMLGCLNGKVISFDRKYTIIAEGSTPRHIGILLSGSAQMARMDYYGNRSIVSGIAPGEMFAEAFACAEVDFMPVSVVACEPSEVMLIDCGHILHTCSNNCGFHQQLIFNLMKSMAFRSLEAYEKIDITSKRTTREKLLAYLNRQAKRSGSSRFEIPFDRQELADYLEVDRSGLSAEISKLRSEGVLKSSRKQFELL